MDHICLRELKLDTVIGIHAWERQVRQTLKLDLEIGLDTRRAAASDRLADTLDYHVLAQRLVALAAGAQFQLIEALVEACARVVIQEFGAARVCLTLHKPGAVREAADVALRIERSRGDYT